MLQLSSDILKYITGDTSLVISQYLLPMARSSQIEGWDHCDGHGSPWIPIFRAAKMRRKNWSKVCSQAAFEVD